MSVPVKQIHELLISYTIHISHRMQVYNTKVIIHYTKDDDTKTIYTAIHDTIHDTYTYRGTVGKCWGNTGLDGEMVRGKVGWTPRAGGP